MASDKQQKRSKFATQDVRFADTRECGSITVRGIQLETDEDGCISGPPSISADIAPHGFFPEGSPEFAAFMAKRGAPPEPKKPPVSRKKLIDDLLNAGSKLEKLADMDNDELEAEHAKIKAKK